MRHIREIAIGLLIIVLSLRLDLIGLAKTAVKKCFRSEAEKNPDEISFPYVIAITFLAVSFAILLLYKLDTVPAPYHIDEIGMTYDALSIARYGVDRFLYKYPVYLINFGGGQSALYAYLAALCIKLFGYSVITVRIPAVLMSCAAALFFAHAMRKEYGNASAVILTGLFCVLPFSIMHSRWGLDCYLLFPMLIISCSCFITAIKSNKTWQFAVSGLFFGLTLYSYALSYLIVPILLAFCILILFWTGQIKWKHLFALGIPLFILASPLLLFLAVNNGIIEEIRTPFISIPKLPGYRGGEINLHNIAGNVKFNKLNIFYRILAYDGMPYNVLIKYGTMFYFTLPLLLWGTFLSFKNAVKELRNRVFSLDIMMIILFFTGTGISLMLYKTNISRANELFIPLFYFLSVGLLAVYQKRKTAAAAAAIIFIINFGFFYRDYLIEYPKELEKPNLVLSMYDMQDALDFVKTINSSEKSVFVSGQPYLWVILGLQVDPYTLHEKTEFQGTVIRNYENYIFRDFSMDQISTQTIYIFNNPEEMPADPEEYGFDVKRFNSVYVMYAPDN